MVKKLKCYSISELNEYIKKVGTDKCSFYFSEPCHQLLLWTDDHCYGLNDVIDLDEIAEKTTKPKKLTKESGLWQYLVSILGNDLHATDFISISRISLSPCEVREFVKVSRVTGTASIDTKSSWYQENNHFFNQLKTLLEGKQSVKLSDLFEFED